MSAERLVQIGMRAAIRDVQEWVTVNAWSGDSNDQAVADADDLRAYLLAMLITADAYEDGYDQIQRWGHDGQS